jgi:hypothetical protein
MKFTLFFASFLLCACARYGGPSVVARPTAASTALSFLPSRAEKGTLFRYYQPKAESKWRNNWTSKFDLTGVSWNDPRTATLIAPNYVVMAAHFARPANIAVMFHDKNGIAYERYITAVRSLKVGDVAVAKLNLPLPPAIKTYPFAAPNDATSGRLVIITDQTNTLSVHRIAVLDGGVIRFNFANDLDPIYRRNLIVGDSGNPSFIIKNGDLALIETHTTGGPGAGPFYGDPGLQAAIRGAIVEMGH